MKPLSDADVARLRDETPGAGNRVHLNSAGASLMPAIVVESMKTYLDQEAALGGYEAAEARAPELDTVYASVARLIGAEPDEIALVENSTIAWDLAFYSQEFEPGDVILTAVAEYAANYVAFLQVCKRTGARVEVVANDASGETDPEAMRQAIERLGSKAKLVAMTYLPTNGGLVNPAADLGRVCRDFSVPYLLDACQAVGQMPVDVDDLGCDFLAATGRKFLRGPRGSGFLYVRRELIATTEPPMIDHFAAPWVDADRFELRCDARRFETWENNYAARLGLGIACDYAMNVGLERIRDRVRRLAERMREGLGGIDGVKIYDVGVRLSAIVTFVVPFISAPAVKSLLREANINVSVSEASATLLDARARSLPLLVRASPHYFNTEEEVDLLVETVREVRKTKALL